MSVRAYLEFLEKNSNAAEGDAEHESVSRPDNVESTVSDHNRIMEDSRSYLHSVFSQAGAVQNNQTAELKKMFSMPHDTIISNPLIKVAFRETFFQAMGDANLMKKTSSIHQEVAFNAFFDELEKISASLAPLGGGALKARMPGQMGIVQAGHNGATGFGNALSTIRNSGTRGGGPLPGGGVQPANALHMGGGVESAPSRSMSMGPVPQTVR